MAKSKSVVFDEIHLTIRVPAALPKTRTEPIRRRLQSAAVMGRLRRTVQTLFREYRELAAVRVTVAR